MQQDNLFSKPAEYTIDSCALMAMFNDEPWTSKRTTPGLWERISGLIADGVVISHAEVLAEIKKDGQKGEELFSWANANVHVFKAHEIDAEGAIIRSMSAKYKAFVANYGKATDAYADPWLIAQAKNRGLKIITQETRSGNPKTPRLPNVCDDRAFGVRCVTLLELTTERKWAFR
ncbi:MAG: DUF4411 family protein [Terriglobia bacterium]|jgi:hypothetical protein